MGKNHIAGAFENEWSESISGFLPCKHVLMIPTNREIDYCIDSYLSEISENINASRIEPENIMLVVVEDGTNESVSHNAELLALKKSAGKWPCTVLHVTPSMVASFLSTLIQNDEELSSVFFKRGVNYGRIANIMSLIAASLGAEYLHRRDSDTSIHQEEGKLCSPLAAEADFFNKSRSDLSIIGSNYLMSSDIDISIFANVPDCIPVLYQLVGMDEKTIQSKMNSHQTGSKILCSKVDGGLWPDMGNIAFRNIFAEYAFPSHENTLGSDYFLMQLAEAANMPMYLHNQCINHLMGPERLEEKYRVRYYLMLARCIDFFTVYMNLYDMPGIQDNVTGEKLSDILESLAEKGRIDVNYRTERLLQYANLFSGIGTSLGSMLYAKIKESSKEIIAENDRANQEHAFLQKKWPSLTKKAAELFIMNAMQ